MAIARLFKNMPSVWKKFQVGRNREEIERGILSLTDLHVIFVAYVNHNVF